MVHLVKARNFICAIAIRRIGILLIGLSCLGVSFSVGAGATTGTKGTGCEYALKPKVQLRTSEDLIRFVDYRGLEGSPDDALTLQHLTANQVKLDLAMQTGALAEKMVHLNFLVSRFLSRNQDALASPHENLSAFKRSIGYYEVADRILEHQKLLLKVDQHLAALDRISDRRSRWFRKDPYGQSLRIEARICVAGKSTDDLIAAFFQRVHEAEIPGEDVVFRFFDSSREDLVRLTGTDRAGDRTLHAPTTMLGMPDHSLRVSDNFINEFYGLDASGLRYGQFGNRPYPMINDFIGGTKSVAIYLATGLKPTGHETYTFRRLSRRTSRLVGVITPANEAPCR